MASRPPGASCHHGRPHLHLLQASWLADRYSRLRSASARTEAQAVFHHARAREVCNQPTRVTEGQRNRLMQLRELVDQVAGFDAAAPGEKIRLFAWWLHTHRNMVTFKTGDIRGCYEQLHLPMPNIAMYLTRMTNTKPAKALRKGDNYNLTRDARTDLDAKYGIHPTIQAVSKLLADLPDK